MNCFQFEKQEENIKSKVYKRTQIIKIEAEINRTANKKPRKTNQHD